MLSSIIGTELTLSVFLICTAVSMALGVGLALVSQFRARSSQSFAVTLAILPAVGLFDDLFAQYTTAHTLVKVKTSNMGTLYELEYRVTLPEDCIPKAFLDALRCRNGNLNIVCGRELTKDVL